ncbi:MAG: sugar ABC transporter permease [Turicibacter sp.]|nr:sugar ABC transporter permease [Turicibacter sp.]
MEAKVHLSQNKKAKAKNTMVTILLYSQIILVCFIVLIPIIWVIGSSFNPGTTLASAQMFPDNPTLRHYIDLFRDTNYLNWYFNTFKIAVIHTIFSVFLSTSTGYVFSRFVFKGKKAALITMLILQMFPSFMAMVALYVLFLTFGLLDTHWALILIYAAGQIPVNTWVIKGYLTSIPKELDESAMLDGASKLQTFSKIIFPLMKPIISFVAVTAFMTPWMDFIFPRLILSSNANWTLAVGLFDMITGTDMNNYTMFAAGAVLVAIPITILYVAMQKYLIEGVTAGASKG